MPCCDVCQRDFTKARNVKRHVEEQHTNNKYFVCCENKCKTSFKRRSNLSQHLEKKHGYSKMKAKSASIKSKPRTKNVMSSGFYSDISNTYSEISTDDEVLDLVKELDEILDIYIPEDTSNSFVDDLLEATGNSYADSSLVTETQYLRQVRRRRRRHIPKLRRHLSRTHLLRLTLPRNLRRFARWIASGC